ncbi:winged helix-turn-helix transcriptional regulator [Chengkuizengella marina]|uniref:Transcriptional regulator n=1 Tax=Chengkuizengella marina TaxID=2507566 RepID=A0A6N9Q5C6_9BACL|nr:helix-turn-helix domain-containing protein [Chengkuizengella marina]NBI30036.1 transcriptional regulator [Chengkuizengella marina]
MSKQSHQEDLCPKLTSAMQLFGKRWVGLIIYTLLTGPKRFRDIEKSLPISGKLLAERLRELEKYKLVIRHVYPEVPVRIEYELTENGKAMQPIIEAIQEWAESLPLEDICQD